MWKKKCSVSVAYRISPIARSKLLLSSAGRADVHEGEGLHGAGLPRSGERGRKTAIVCGCILEWRLVRRRSAG